MLALHENSVMSTISVAFEKIDDFDKIRKICQVCKNFEDGFFNFFRYFYAANFFQQVPEILRKVG